MRNKKKFVYNNEDIVFEYFKLIKNKDMESLMELFAPDAIVYEPFSKITEGLKGKRAIESFLRVAVMANDTLQHQIVLEKEVNLNKLESNYKYGSSNKTGNNNSTNVITALVKFEKGDSVRARFTFELASDNSGNDDAITHQKYNRIKTLYIQFLK